MPSVALKAGTIHYESSGPEDGRPVVFVHGYAMGLSLWRPLSERLVARGLRCLAPTWPLGAQTEPMRQGADLSMEGVAGMVGEFLEGLGLEGAVLTGNDTGGAIAQIVATSTPARLAGLVLTGCDAFEHFPPPVLKPLIAAAKFPPAFQMAVQPLRTRLGRKQAYGKLAYTDIDDLAAEWVKPALTDKGTREDLRRFTASMNRQSMVLVGEHLAQFAKPSLVAWAANDEFFPLEDGRRLAATLPDCRLEIIEDARTFSMIDQPDVLANLIAEFTEAKVAQQPS